MNIEQSVIQQVSFGTFAFKFEKNVYFVAWIQNNDPIYLFICFYWICIFEFKIVDLNDPNGKSKVFSCETVAFCTKVCKSFKIFFGLFNIGKNLGTIPRFFPRLESPDESPRFLSVGKMRCLNIQKYVYYRPCNFIFKHFCLI